MYTGFHTTGVSRIHYCCWGAGPELLFCFHGYGESAGAFAFLEEALGRDYTLIAVDMPFHGQTEWKEGLFFAPQDLRVLLEAIAAGLPGRQEKWTLLGYSMGGRVALQLVELMPGKIKKLVLLAPDGLQMNPWYWLATQTRAGNLFFRYTMGHPDWFFFLLRVGNALKWVNPGIYKFTIRYINDVAVRRQLYTRWTTMRGFRPHRVRLRDLVRSQGIQLRFLYGRYDRIILPYRGARFLKGLEKQSSLLVLPSGHQLLQAIHLDALVTAITF